MISLHVQPADFPIDLSFLLFSFHCRFTIIFSFHLFLLQYKHTNTKLPFHFYLCFYVLCCLMHTVSRVVPKTNFNTAENPELSLVLLIRYSGFIILQDNRIVTVKSVLLFCKCTV